MFLAIYTAKYGEKQNLNHCVKKKLLHSTDKKFSN